MKRIRKSLILFAILITMLFVTIIASLTSEINSFKLTNDLSTQIKSQNASVNETVQPKLLSEVEDIKIVNSSLDEGMLSTEKVIDNDGNYILPASNKNETIAKIAKLNSSFMYLYEWSYSYSNYKTRQIVADIDDVGYYYALLVNENAQIKKISGDTANDFVFEVENPAVVVQLHDTGSQFETINTYSLDLPDFGINNKENYSSTVANGVNVINNNAADNIWDHVYVADPISSLDKNENLSFIRGKINDEELYINSSEKNTVYKMLGSEGKIDHNGVIINDGSYYMLTKLYLNNANNMVYLKDYETNKKMIMIFGGNLYQSFWFYDFEITTNSADNNNKYYVSPMLYANYDYNPFDMTSIHDVSYQVDPEYNVGIMANRWLLQGRAINQWLPFLLYNKVSYLAWYVGGAKTIVLTDEKTQTKTSYVFLAILQPNMTDYNEVLFNPNNATDSVDIDLIKKNTYATTNYVSLYNESNYSNGEMWYKPSYNSYQILNENPQIDGKELNKYDPVFNPSLKQTYFVQEIEKQESDYKYTNREILVGSSSINASYTMYFTSFINGPYANKYPQWFWRSDASTFLFPFSAIQSVANFPIMTSSMASYLAKKPYTKNQDLRESIKESIYLTDLLKNLNRTSFKLFNCYYFPPTEEKTNAQFKNFKFTYEYPKIRTSWIKDKHAGRTIGVDKAGFSRVLLHTNPENADDYLSDGWYNIASQKIVAFSPQLTSNKVTVGDKTYNEIAATTVFRGYTYTFTYDLSETEGILSFARNNKMNSENLDQEPSTDNISTGKIDPNKNYYPDQQDIVINKFSNLINILYINNKWYLTYQDANGRYLNYGLEYIENSSVRSTTNCELQFNEEYSNLTITPENKASDVLSINDNGIVLVKEDNSITTQNSFPSIPTNPPTFVPDIPTNPSTPDNPVTTPVVTTKEVNMVLIVTIIASICAFIILAAILYGTLSKYHNKKLSKFKKSIGTAKFKTKPLLLLTSGKSNPAKKINPIKANSKLKVNSSANKLKVSSPIKGKINSPSIKLKPHPSPVKSGLKINPIKTNSKLKVNSSANKLKVSSPIKGKINSPSIKLKPHPSPVKSGLKIKPMNKI